MKVLGISGGSFNGSNDAMTKEALMGAEEQGAEVEFIRLLDLNIRPCTGCIACVNSLMAGGNGDCVLKDDFNWLKNKIWDADAVIWAMPVYEKGAAAVFHLVKDRLCGPANDKGMNIIAGKIAEETGGTGPDPRKMKPLVVSYIGIGGSDWTTRTSCDLLLSSMSSMWQVADMEIFNWCKSIIIQDENVARCHQLGVNTALAARDPERVEYKGTPGICPVCHCSNFFIHQDGVAECEVCSVKGELVKTETGMEFKFPESELEHAHTLLPAKFKHMDDIRENEGQFVEDKKTDKYKAQIARYKAYIKASKPS